MNYLMSVFFVSIFFQNPAHAALALPDQLFKNVHYDCDIKLANQYHHSKIASINEYNANMKKFYELVMSEGIQRLNELNPALAQKLITAYQTQTLWVDCDQADRGENETHLEVMYYHNPENLNEGAMDIGKVAEFIQTIAQAHALTSSEVMESFVLDHERGYTEHFSINQIFHESLHFAGIGNFFGRDHDLNSSGHKAWEDLVYSCADAVYRNEDWFEKKEDHEKAIAMCKSGH